MNKKYNRNTTSDIPLDASVSSTTSVSTKAKSAKPKITAIGKKAQNQIKSKSTRSAKSRLSNQEMNTDNKKNIQDVADLEKLNEENLKSFKTKSKRSRVAIVLLVLSLIIAISVIAVYLAITKLQVNCKMKVYGADAVYYVDGEILDEFRAPSNLRGNARLDLEIKLKIQEDGMFDIKFKPNCYQNEELMINTLVYDLNNNLFIDGGDGYYYSRKPISGNQTIRLCEGVIFSYEYRYSLNINNFRMEFETYLEKV